MTGPDIHSYFCPGGHRRRDRTSALARMIVGVCLALLAALTTAPADAAVVRSARWENMGSYVRLTIEVSAMVKNNVRNEIGSNGSFYIDLSGITEGFRHFPPPPGGLGVNRVQSTYTPSLDIQRFVFYVQDDAKFEVTTLVNPARLVIDIAREDKPLAINPTRKKVIVIDPGHGGVSTGARSRSLVNGKYVWEKDVVMDYARRLERVINQSPNMRAVMTRRGDTFVSLGDRVKYAVDQDGDIFISLHCNSAPGTRPVKAEGLEIYTWNEQAVNDAAMKHLEGLENDAAVSTVVNGRHDPQLKKVFSNMMGDMLEQQRALSELLANDVYASMRKQDYYRSRGRGVKSARFIVLRNFEVPSILVELGFMPNPREVKKMCDPNFQEESVRAIYNGLCHYFTKADKTFLAAYVSEAGN